jgi:hypothetical protein
MRCADRWDVISRKEDLALTITMVPRGREEVHTGFWWGDLKERDHLKNPGVDERIILKWIFQKWDGGGTGVVLL